MKKISKILLFITLLVLLVGVVSATELSDNSIAANEITEQAVQDPSMYLMIPKVKVLLILLL